MANQVHVKICGITNRNDALKAAEFGAWALGFVFYKKSPRYISPSRAAKIIEELPPFVTPVGVFVNPNEGALRQITKFCRLQTLQLHGYESPALASRLSRDFKVIKAFRVEQKVEIETVLKYKTSAYLFDAFQDGSFGGTGQTFSWELLKKAPGIGRPVILSGGLHSENVLEAIRAVNPYAVDVSSGVEKSPGEKDSKLMKKFLEKVTTYG